MERKPTSFDVAKLAGVSRSAVSRAFTPGGRISPQTKEKVTRAASELGYRVNSLARGLQQDHSGIVGLVASRLDTPLRSSQVARLSELLIREGFKPMLITAERPDHVGTLIESLLGYNVAGMIFTSDTPPPDLIKDCARFGLPVVLINRPGNSGWGDRVVADNLTGGSMAAQLLIDCGATRLGCLMPRRETFSVSGRAQAFVDYATERGHPVEVLLADDQGYADARAGIAKADADVLHRIDGLFCSTDLMALGALDALRIDRGIKVPEQMQVLGFDNIEQAGWGSYDLSTISQDIDAQAATVVRLLIERMAGDASSNKLEQEPLTAILRGTTRHAR
ncbi:LacI family DNA-binding transcriptional regulator [Ponticoccus sp. SC6-36]|nr:LacI family DNA-binding transcriptional regulator [Ponticoccus sp. SC6-36]